MVFLIAILFLFYLYPKTWHLQYLVYLPIIIYLYDIVPGRTFGTNNPYFHLMDYAAIAYVFSDFLRKTRKFKINYGNTVKLFLIFTFLQLFTVFFSSDKPYTLLNVIMVILFMASYIVYYKLFSVPAFSKLYFKLFLRNIQISLFLFFFTIILFSILGVKSKEGYGGENIVSFGRLGFFGLYPIIYSLMVLFYLIKSGNNKVLNSILWVSFLIIFFLLAKRTYVALILLGSGIILLGSFKNFLNMIIPLIISFLILFQVQNFVVSYFITKRGNVLNQKLSESGRYQEYAYYFTNLTNEFELINVLLGNEYFNSKEALYFTSGNSPIEDFGGNRILHSDYAIILYGCGIIGLLTYFLFLISLLLTLFKISKINSNNSIEITLIKITILALWVALFVNGFADGYRGFLNRLVPFSYIGAFTGYLYFLTNENKETKRRGKDLS